MTEAEPGTAAAGETETRVQVQRRRRQLRLWRPVEIWGRPARQER